MTPPWHALFLTRPAPVVSMAPTVVAPATDTVPVLVHENTEPLTITEAGFQEIRVTARIVEVPA